MMSVFCGGAGIVAERPNEMAICRPWPPQKQTAPDTHTLCLHIIALSSPICPLQVQKWWTEWNKADDMPKFKRDSSLISKMSVF